MFSFKKSVILIFIFCLTFIISGCFSGASPGLKVIKITEEQYLNDAKRYLRTAYFIYDTSKISQIIRNLEKNYENSSDEIKKQADVMLAYLKILNLHAYLFKSGRIPDEKKLKEAYESVLKCEGKESEFLTLFYIYIKSFSEDKNTLTEILNSYMIYNYFMSLKHADFPYSFGGLKVNKDLITRFYVNILSENGYCLQAYDIVKNFNEKINLNLMNMLTKGEFYTKIGLYDKAENSLKYFRLPVYQNYPLKDYALALLSYVYKFKDMELDSQSVKRKIEITLSFSPERIFRYYTEEEKKLYSLMFNDKMTLQDVEDVFDLTNKRNYFIKLDFSYNELYEVKKYAFLKFNKKIEFKEKGYGLYDFEDENKFENKIYVVFYDKYLKVISPEKFKKFFVKINTESLRERKGKFYFDFKKKKDKIFRIEIEGVSEKDKVKVQKYVLRGVNG